VFSVVHHFVESSGHVILLKPLQTGGWVFRLSTKYTNLSRVSPNAPFQAELGGQRWNSWLVFRRQVGGIIDTIVFRSGEGVLELLIGPPFRNAGYGRGP
jgi:hypothetical protein